MPAIAVEVAAPAKRPAIGSSSDYLQHQPAWRLSSLDTAGPFGWERLKAEEWRFLRQCLTTLEAQTWKEILVRDRNRHHRIEVEKLSKPARDRLLQLHLDDLDELLSLRVRSRERVFGILREGVSYALWWDPHHEVCPAPKKHT